MRGKKSSLHRIGRGYLLFSCATSGSESTALIYRVLCFATVSDHTVSISHFSHHFFLLILTQHMARPALTVISMLLLA